MLRWALASLVLVLASCAGTGPATGPVHPDPSAPAVVGASQPSFAQTGGVAKKPPRPVDPSMITHGTRAALFQASPPEPKVALCAKGGRRPLVFDEPPTYTEKLERGHTFRAHLFVRNDANCTRRVSLPLSFTPPKTTDSRTVEFAAFVPPRGAFVELTLDARELAEAGVIPGRYAITFAVLDEEGGAVGRALSGNAFRLGRDEIAIATAPALPREIGRNDDLVVSFTIENRGDTGNRVTPLVVFTRPGDTKGLEHYDPAQPVPPGTSTYDVRLTPTQREQEGIGPGAWLVTVSLFDAAGDRANTFAGMPITIGKIDVHVNSRPELPVRVRATEAIAAKIAIENRGDTADKVTTVMTFTKPGTTLGHELTFTRDIGPGTQNVDLVITPAERKQRGIDKGVWLVATSVFRGSGDKVKSFTGHYLEILE